jgi:chemotaxis protein histidine kinase CheA/ActR/RegA family two-component response regulator
MAEHDRILGYFLEEAKDHLNTIEQGLRKLPETVRQPATIRELFRAAHSIKGSAAMLGLLDVQQVGNQFEANFKLLKEQPTIAVDPKLQNLFLESFSFLRAAITEVSTSPDPYRRDPNSPDPVGDPVFEELKSYLQQLLRAVDAPAAVADIAEQSFSQDPAVEQVFGEYVTRKLGEINGLCLQSDSPAIRAQIQQICQKLGSLGDNFEFLQWTNLFTGCRLAVANPNSTLHQLGESISIAVKQAQILILSDRHQAIGITPDLEALIDSPEARFHQRRNGSAPSIETNSSTVRLEQTPDRFAANGSMNGVPVPLESAPGLSSIYERVQPLQLDSDRLADFTAVPEANFTPGEMLPGNGSVNELDEFMQNMLREELPNDGTWMQDDEFSGSDDFALDFDLDEPSTAAPAESKADRLYEQMFEPVSQPAPVIPSRDSAKLPASEEIQYDEATFFTPDFGDSEDPDIATFWSDSPFDEAQSPLYGIDGLDLPANVNDRQFQPEQPLDRELDSSLPTFALDDRPISELFPTATPTDLSLEFDDADPTPVAPSMSVAEPLADNFNDFSGEFSMDDFDEDLQLNETVGRIDPFHSIGTMDTVEQGLSTHEQAESNPAPAFTAETANELTIVPESPALPDTDGVGTDIDFGIDILADTDASEEFFTDLNFSDSIELEQIAVAEQLADDSIQPEIAELSFAEPESTDLAPANVATEGTDGADTLLTGWLDSYSDLHQLDDLSDLDLNSFSMDESIEDSASGNDLDFNVLNSAVPIAATSVGDNFGDSDLDGLDWGEPIAEQSIEHDLAVDLDFNNAAVADLQLTEPDFTALDVPVIEPVDALPTQAVNDDFTDLDLDGFDRQEAIVDLTFDDLSDLNFPAGGDLEPVASQSIGDDPEFVNLNLEFELPELPIDLAADENFTNLAAIDPTEPARSTAMHDTFMDFDLDVFNNPESGANLSIGGNFAEIDALGDTAPINLPLGAEFTDLDLDFGGTASEGELSLGAEFTDLDLDFGGTASEAELSLGAEFTDLDLDFGGTASEAELSLGAEFTDLDLDFGDTASEAELSLGAEFTDLDFAGLSDPESSVALSGSDDFANLDLNNLSSEISADEFTDLGSILDASTDANAGIGDLDALLSGAAAVGIGGVALAAGGSEFDDLDALMGTPAPANDLNDLDGLLGEPATVVAPPAPATAEAKPDRRSKQRTFEQTMRVSVRHLDNLNNLVGELVVNRNTLEQDQNRMRQFIEKLLSEVQKLNEVGKRMQDLYERSLMENSLIASRQQSKPQAPQSIPGTEILDQTGALMEYDPLEMDRFTPIHLLSQKMIELTVRVRESTADIEFVVDGSTEVTRTLRQITGQLQEDLTKSRMVPFAQTADRLQRGVRDNGLKYGKQVELSIEGRDTLIDKVILESLTDPLIHMVNNGIAHGIESAETRLAAGKPALGTISVRAIHQGNQTIISIADDGAGINAERVKTKAIEKGIITAQQALTMTKAEVYDLLFLPSFSTKDEADELAGRGVGMDVVRTSLNEIRGTITTESQLGIGTTFTIRLPLALSIAKALIAVNNKNNIAFPMDGIEDTQDVSPEQIQTNSAGEQCIFWRDNLMPFKPLSDLLGFNRPLPRNNFYGTQEDDSDLVSILILRSDGNLLAVQVDKIIGDQEIVIKPLQGPASKPLGIAGATVLGDGQIVPIADVMELIDLARGTLVRHVSAQWASEMVLPTNEQQESMVLIVDDSITVRELLSLTFKRAGYRVEQARDGQEAWDKLRAGLPCDIVFCDIEMPRMDGLEFLSRVQKDVALSKVPVAMLTSRGSDRHRQIAAQLGASGYFIKPYLEEALLDAAKRMIKGEVLAIV